MNWNVYLSGEIHTDWRQQIKAGCETLSLPVHFTSAVTDHEASDAAGDVLGNNKWGQSTVIANIRNNCALTPLKLQKNNS